MVQRGMQRKQRTRRGLTAVACILKSTPVAGRSCGDVSADPDHLSATRLPLGVSGRRGRVCLGNSPDRLLGKATISATCSFVKSLLSCVFDITCTASSSVATEPLWKYGAVSATLRQVGTRHMCLSTSSFVTSKRPLSSMSLYLVT